ncbi:MAG: hypothetical protein BroJett030_22760 [Alphaproteobacteria bacterium]|nr:MAG: hypothetical protein BroJett030_22760 [Alphaproteobacteria bacterium]
MRISITPDRSRRTLSKPGRAPDWPARPNTSAARSIIKLACAAATALSLGACSLNARTAALDSEPELITASVARQVKAEGIDSTDAETIKQAVVSADSGPSALSLAWSNPDTGNRGTIMAIERFVGNEGQNCRKFQTTVDSFMGISIYKGETCELRAGLWVLSGLLREKE